MSGLYRMSKEEEEEERIPMMGDHNASYKYSIQIRTILVKTV